MDIEHKHFNCSQEHEFTYVAGLYLESAAVKNWLREKCADGTIHYSTHKEIYAMLAAAGFHKIA